jgi:hypothetical protein
MATLEPAGARSIEVSLKAVWARAGTLAGMEISRMAATMRMRFIKVGRIDYLFVF